MDSIHTISLLLMFLAFASTIPAEVIKFQQHHDKATRIINESPSQPSALNSSGLHLDPCTSDKCKPPNCRCSSTIIPGTLTAPNTPQIVLLSFQNAVNDQNFFAYDQLFKGRRNPNGCPAVGTFFVSHEWTNYFEVQTLYSKRHEIGDNLVTQYWAYYWQTAKEAQWQAAISDQRKILSKFGNVSLADISGFRAPFLQLGGDNEYQALAKSGLKYDATRLTWDYTTSGNFLWPYTCDYASIQDCAIPPCPTQPYSGFWEVPLAGLYDKDGRRCATPEGCNVTSQADAFNLFRNAFLQHYKSNKAPLLLSIGTLWLLQDYKLQGTMQFLDSLKQYKDVYIVTVRQAIEWVRNPQPLSKLASFKPWSCKGAAPPVCSTQDIKTCLYDSQRRKTMEGETYRMLTCLPCPSCYPWESDPTGSIC